MPSQVRKCFGLPMVSNWSDINPALASDAPDLFLALSHLYGSPSDVDPYVGGMMESNEDPGPLFR